MRVLLDGEGVDFQGDAPESASGLWQLIESHLATSGRFIASFIVDEKEWSLGSDEQANIELVEIRSEGQAARLAALLRKSLDDETRLRKELESESRMTLSSPWAKSVPRLSELLNRLEPLLHLSATLAEYARQNDWESADFCRADSDDMVAAVNTTIDGVEKGSCVLVSDTLVYDFSPALKRFLDKSRSVYLPTLEGSSID